MKQPKYKIALIGEMLSKGGAEKVQAQLSIYFESVGIEVHHIIMEDFITYPYAGSIFNLGKLKKDSNGLKIKVKRLSAFASYIKNNSFDYIIDFRVRYDFKLEFFLINYIFKSSLYITSLRSYLLPLYLPENKFIAKKIFKKTYGFVTVTEALEKKIRSNYKFGNIKTIYNPLDFEKIEELSNEYLDIKYNYILGVGRMQNNIKQFDHLIEAYYKSKAIENSIKLILIGDGSEKKKLQNLVISLKIKEHVIFIPYSTNPYKYYKKAFVTALTSKNEGFPNVLIESLACETPIIAYDCESGPQEIIVDQENGLLVDNQSIEAMTKAINRMITDKKLYKSCKLNAKKSINHLALEIVGKKWLQFLKINN